MLIKFVALSVKTSDHVVTSKVPPLIWLALILTMSIQIVIEMSSCFVVSWMESWSSKEVSIITCPLNVDSIINAVDDVVYYAQELFRGTNKSSLFDIFAF